MKKKQASGYSDVYSETQEKLFALTLKVERGLYVRLTSLRGREGRTHQEILKTALEQYLRRCGV